MELDQLLAVGLYISIPGNRQRSGIHGEIVKLARVNMVIRTAYFDQFLEIKWSKRDIENARVASLLPQYKEAK